MNKGRKGQMRTWADRIVHIGPGEEPATRTVTFEDGSQRQIPVQDLADVH